MELSVGNVIVIAISATLAAIGTASIPNGALVSLITVLQVGLLCQTATLELVPFLLILLGKNPKNLSAFCVNINMQAVSLDEYISDLSILFAVDWVLGMFRTSVNIWGDACACVIVDTWEKQRLKKQAEGGTESESLIS